MVPRNVIDDSLATRQLEACALQHQPSCEYVLRWFTEAKGAPFPFQEASWQAYLDGHDFLIHSSTGSGKTLAAFLGPVIQWIADHGVPARGIQSLNSEASSSEPTSVAPKRTAIDRMNRVRPTRSTRRTIRDSRLHLLWITPLRALAIDLVCNLKRTVAELGIPWEVEFRTSDTPTSVRSLQRKSLPHVLVTTPESVSVMLSMPDWRQQFCDLQLVVVDEWHELIGTKRGTQTELALARLRIAHPTIQVCGLSATLGNTALALRTLVGKQREGIVISDKRRTTTELDCVIPCTVDRFPWAGHLGTSLVEQVVDIIRAHRVSLLFTNTRSQTELWYRALSDAAPDLREQFAVHHGSVARDERLLIEDQLRTAKLRCCICTSSLDLGVDFPIVDHVIQVGSPKGIARLLQRAGRSNHQPGQPNCVTLVPTNSLELIEFAALRAAIAEGGLETKPPLAKPMDVLVQHLVTAALGGGFTASELFAEVATTVAYHDLSPDEWQWALSFASHGGTSLAAYPDYHRLEVQQEKYVVTNARLAARHRMSIGTIVEDAAITVRFLKGGNLGTVEESFIGRIKPGDRFSLGGRLLELISIRDNVAWVKRSTGLPTAVPRWLGGRLPYSSELATCLRRQVERSTDGDCSSSEMRAAGPLLEIQQAWSAIPRSDQVLIERLQHRLGCHLFVYPFEGRLVHEGLASLLAWRLTCQQSITITLSMNDYGFVLVSPDALTIESDQLRFLLRTENALYDMQQSVNAGELTKRQFREIARISGLTFQGPPGGRRNSRHLQASSNLFYDVFREYDPANRLLCQAENEVLARRLEGERLVGVLERINRSALLLREIERPTPFAFPLMVESMRDRMSSESLATRVKRMQSALEMDASKGVSQ